MNLNLLVAPALFYSLADVRSIDRGVLAGEMKRRVFQIPSEMQHGLNSLSLDYTKEGNKRERGLSFGLWCHGATKRKCVRAHNDSFL